MKRIISIATLVAVISTFAPAQAEINKVGAALVLMPSIISGIALSDLGYLTAKQAKRAEISFEEFIGKKEVKDSVKARNLCKVRRNAMCCIGATIGLALLNWAGKTNLNN